MHTTIVTEDDHRAQLGPGHRVADPHVRDGGSEDDADTYGSGMPMRVATAGAEAKHGEEDKESVFCEVHEVGLV